MRESLCLLYTYIYTMQINYMVSRICTFIYEIRASVDGDGVATRGSMVWLVWHCLNGGRECSGTVELNHSLMDRAANL